MIIKFKKINSIEYGRTVEIIGKVRGYNEEIKIEMSILQLAKVWRTDKKVVSNVENDFGSMEYEDKCEETRKKVTKFPDVKIRDRKIEMGYTSMNKLNNKDNVNIYGEDDIVGWDNEGIRIEIPKKIYDEELNGKEFEVILTPFEILLKVKK